MVSENPDDKFVDKSKLTQEVVDKYQTLLSQGASIKKIVAKLNLEDMVIVPENEKDNEEEWVEKIAEHMATQILPKIEKKVGHGKKYFIETSLCYKPLNRDHKIGFFTTS